MESPGYTDFSSPAHLLLLTVILFAIVFLRYLILSGLYHYLFYKLFRKRFGHRIINPGTTQKKQVKKEMAWSALTSLIFAVSGTVMLVLWQSGYTAIYTEISAFPLWYMPLSLIVTLFIHETYYYWLHRWMHLPKIYRIIHKVHHESMQTSTLTSFSFHPLESVLQAAIIPLIVFFLPMHPWVLLFLLLYMTVSGTINHAGIEVYPRSFIRHWFGRWFIGATHHDLHHKQFRYNFGLYFTFWDKWMKTESPVFKERFTERTAHEK